MKNIKRTILIGSFLGIIFFGWILYAFYHQNWNFRLFSLKDWMFIGHEFANGWVISSTSDWIFVVSLLVAVPVFIYLWRICCRVQWRKTTKTTYQGLKKALSASQQPVKPKKVKIKAKKSHKKVRPQPMMSVGRPAIKSAGRTMDAATEKAFSPSFANTQSESEREQPEIMQPAFLDDDIANIPLEDIQLPEQVRLSEDLPAILSDANYQVIRDVVFNDFTFSLVGISADTVVLCATDTEKGDWLADEEFFNNEEPLWFSESSHRISPVYLLSKAVTSFTQKLKDAGLTQQVCAVFIEKDGTIINAEDMRDAWQKMGISVCRTDLGGPEELPGFAETVPPATDKGSAVIFDAIHDLF